MMVLLLMKSLIIPPTLVGVSKIILIKFTTILSRVLDVIDTLESLEASYSNFILVDTPAYQGFAVSLVTNGSDQRRYKSS